MRAAIVTSAALAIAVSALASACLADRDPVGPDIPDCALPRADTTSWTRVAETQSDPSGLAAASITWLVPPTFNKISPRRWERGATAIGWQATFGGPVPQPFPEMTHTGSCRANISDTRVVFDYGTIVSGGPNPDAVIVVRWPNAGTSGSILFDARMGDLADRSILERMLWSVQITGRR